MASLLVALLVAIAEPVAPVVPTISVVEMPALNPSPAPASTSPRRPSAGPMGMPVGKPIARQVDRDARAEPLLDLAGPARPDSGEPVSIPPNLTGAALREELRAAAQRRQAELASLGREGARLEKLVADIAAARGALEKETARLDELIRKAAADKAMVAAAPRKLTPDEEKRALAMAKTLKSMKPDQAATLLARLDRPLAVSLLRRMRPGDSGAVLEKMKPETAADLFSLMASPEAAGGTR